jgi:tetratricopeptide (TPR) repeat protein
MLMDRELEQYEAWGVIAMPATALLGKDLQVVYEFSGRPTSAYEDMRDQVMKVLGIEEEIAAAEKPKRERYRASKSVMLNYGLSKILFGRGQFSKAGRKLKKVLQQDPQFPEAHALNGAIQLGLARGGRAGAEQKAREAFDKAIELDDTVPLGLAGAAHFALADGDLPKALELVQRAAEFTELEDMPDLAPASGGAAASEGSPVTAGEKSAESGGGEGSETATAEARAAAVADHLNRAAAALEAGNTAEAGSLTEPVVQGLLNIPNGPKMKGKGLMMQQQRKTKDSQ